MQERIGGLNVQATQLQKVRTNRNRVQARADVLSDVVRFRTRWLEVMDAIHASLSEGMWLTGVRTVIENEEVTHLDISGRGFLDKLVDLPEATAIEQFSQRLTALQLFTEETRIVREPVVGTDAFAREFTIRAELAEAIPLNPPALTAAPQDKAGP